jgi:hypothetical protein
MKKIIASLALFAALACAAAVVVPFSPTSGGTFKLSQGGKLTRVEAFSPVSGGTLALSTIYSAPVYTNAIEISTYTNHEYTVIASNAYTHVVSTNTFPNLSWIDDPGIVNVTTNTAIVATTNRWPVLKETIAVTNSVFSGTQTGYTYTNALGTAVYLAPGEVMRFTGTGVGGWIRLIFE